MEKCKNCAWFCHSNGSCYRPDMMQAVRISTPERSACHSWTFDGLEDWEREACETDALVTMELELA